LLLFGVGELFAHAPAARDPGPAALAASVDGPELTGTSRRWTPVNRPPQPLEDTDPRLAVSVLDPALARAPDAPDPQLMRSRATTGGADGGVGSFGVVARSGHVASVQGDSPVRPGMPCDVRVLPVIEGGFNCLVRVICGGELLYPNPDESAGYVSCDVDSSGPTFAADSMNSGADGDPRLTYDGARQQVVVGDSGEGMRDYLATITLDLPRPFRRL
jgi:hypothetical protein